MDLLQSHVVSKIKVCTVPVPEESLADEYLKRFRRNAFNLDDEEDLVVIWNFVRRYDSAINEPEPVKNNREATNAREAANDAFRGRNFDEALKKYNEGLCWAETGTEEMGLLYGNRSALCYEKGEYQHCLLNIALAKQNQYPERLMPKLETRDLLCRQKIAVEKTSPLPKLPINVKTNPRIPFLANGLMMKGISKYGRAMIAKQVFQPGDVILHERAMISINDPDQWFARCHQCTDIYVFSLIPCPKCISVMYCDEECMTKNWKQVHRFECGFMKRLNRAFSCYVDLGPRIFFYGLSLFGDNVDEMMEYMKTHPRNGSNPFNLDYSKYDPLDEFKNILQVIHNHVLDMTAIPLINFSAVIQCAIYLKNPLVKALFNTKAKQIALISSFVDMMLMLKNITIDNWHMYRASIFPIASICNHSCDPNVFTIVSTLQSEVKMIVIRPIRKGEQIFVTYGPVWYVENPLKRGDHMSLVDIICQCSACDVNTRQSWLAKGKPMEPAATNDLQRAQTIMTDSRSNLADRLNLMQQLVKCWAHTHPNKSLCLLLAAYSQLLSHVITKEKERQMRIKALAAAESALGPRP